MVKFYSEEEGLLDIYFQKYVDSNLFKGLAAGYSLQGEGNKFVRTAKGSFYNGLTFPIFDVSVKIQHMIEEQPDFANKELLKMLESKG